MLSRSIVPMLARFVLVGLASTFVYLVLANLMMLYGVPPARASAFAYLAGMIVSFFGQGRLTFSVARATSRQFARFSLMSIVGLMISVISVTAASRLDLSPAWGTIFAAVAVPVVSFITMMFWVFKDGGSDANQRGTTAV